MGCINANPVPLFFVVTAGKIIAARQAHALYVIPVVQIKSEIWGNRHGITYIHLSRVLREEEQQKSISLYPL